MVLLSFLFVNVQLRRRNCTTPPSQLYSFERRDCSVFSDEGVQFRTAEVFNLAAVFINLAFTKRDYQHKGVATALFRFLLEDIRKENPALKEITLNASPYGKGFYLHLGFIPLSEEQEIDGIRFTPMKYVVR